MPASITTWSRLEPLDQSADLTTSLAAPIADPLWLLHRQWQLGELEGNDAGTPIAVTVTRSRAATRCLPPLRSASHGPGGTRPATTRPPCRWSRSSRPSASGVSRASTAGSLRRRARTGCGC